MGFERYGDYALDVRVFVKREDEYIDGRHVVRDCCKASCGARQPARDTLGLGEPRLVDLSRGAAQALSGNARRDAGPWRRLPELPASGWHLYDDASLDAAWDLVRAWSAGERQKLRDDVPRAGFAAKIRGRTMLDLAKDCLALAEAGLKRRNYLDSEGRDETRYLGVLQEFVARGITPAEELLEQYAGAWGKSVEPVFSEYAY